MKKGAALSLVLALGGTTKFWVTQGDAVCAMARGMSPKADINVPAMLAILFFILASSVGEPHDPIVAGSMVRQRLVVKAPQRARLSRMAARTHSVGALSNDA